MRGYYGRWVMLFGLILALAAAPVVAATSEDASSSGSGPAADAAGTSQVKHYRDVTSPSLEEAVRRLAPTGALLVFPGDELRPSRAITVGEFARLVIPLYDMTLPSGADPNEAAVQALAERGILPDTAAISDTAGDPLSVGNLLAAAVQLADLSDLARDWKPSDNAEASLARAAGVVPASIGSSDELRRSATRSEALELLAALRRISVADGTIQFGDSGRTTASIVSGQGASVRVRLSDQTVVLRNGDPSGADRLVSGDRVRAVVDDTGEARVVLAEGGLFDQTALLERARDVVRILARYLTPEQWQMLIQGDWQGIVSTLTPEMYDRMMALGVSPWEAEALLNRDWPAVREAATDRLAQEGADRLDVSPELLRSVLARDWTTARQLAQQELIEKVINEVIVPAAGATPSSGGSAGEEDSSPEPWPSPPESPGTPSTLPAPSGSVPS